MSLSDKKNQTPYITRNLPVQWYTFIHWDVNYSSMQQQETQAL